MNVPDTVTASRLLLAAPFGYLLFAGHARWTLLAIFALAALTDWFDGFLARRLGQVTARGAWLDQLVDRAFTLVIVALLLVHALFYGEPNAAGAASDTNLPLLLGLACAREVVALPGVLIVLVRRGRLYHVELVGKLATFIQSLTLGAIILGVSWAVQLAYACALIGALSGANYLHYALAGIRRAAPPRSR